MSETSDALAYAKGRNDVVDEILGKLRAELDRRRATAGYRLGDAYCAIEAFAHEIGRMKTTGPVTRNPDRPKTPDELTIELNQKAAGEISVIDHWTMTNDRLKAGAHRTAEFSEIRGLCDVTPEEAANVIVRLRNATKKG